MLRQSSSFSTRDTKHIFLLMYEIFHSASAHTFPFPFCSSKFFIWKPFHESFEWIVPSVLTQSRFILTIRRFSTHTEENSRDCISESSYFWLLGSESYSCSARLFTSGKVPPQETTHRLTCIKITWRHGNNESTCGLSELFLKQAGIPAYTQVPNVFAM